MNYEFQEGCLSLRSLSSPSACRRKRSGDKSLEQHDRLRRNLVSRSPFSCSRLFLTVCISFSSHICNILVVKLSVKKNKGESMLIRSPGQFSFRRWPCMCCGERVGGRPFPPGRDDNDFGWAAHVLTSLCSLTSRLCLRQGAFDRDSFAHSTALGSHLTNPCASPRGPGEGGDGLAHRSPVANRSHPGIHLATHSGSLGSTGHPGAAQRAWHGTAPSQQLKSSRLGSLSLGLLRRSPSYLSKCTEPLVCQMRLGCWMSRSGFLEHALASDRLAS